MKKILDSNSLKIVAISSMLLDHIAYLFIPIDNFLYLIFRFIGRVCAPIMFYSVAKGYFYTRDKVKYGLRLFLFALISQIPYSLFIGNELFLFNKYNVLFTLFLAFLSLTIFDKVEDKLSKFSLILLCLGLSFFCDWGIIGIVYTFIFYLLKDNRYKYVLYCLCSLGYLSINFIIYKNILGFLIGIGLFLVIPLIYLDNGSKGKVYWKYLFYSFYPMHLLILYFVNILF